jgi:glycerol kinase
MQLQSDMISKNVIIPEMNELSAIGAAYCAGIAAGMMDPATISRASRKTYSPIMDGETRQKKYGNGNERGSRLIPRKEIIDKEPASANRDYDCGPGFLRKR